MQQQHSVLLPPPLPQNFYFKPLRNIIKIPIWWFHLKFFSNLVTFLCTVRTSSSSADFDWTGELVFYKNSKFIMLMILQSLEKANRHLLRAYKKEPMHLLYFFTTAYTFPCFLVFLFSLFQYVIINKLHKKFFKVFQCKILVIMYSQ